MNYLYLALATLFFGCISLNKTNYLSSQKGNTHWEVTQEYSYSDQEVVKITISNISGETIFISDPFRLPIFKKEGDGWKKVNIQYCNCMPCPPPPESREVGSGQAFRFTWDKMEESCDGNLLIKSQEGPGLFKAHLNYSLISSDSLRLLTLEFEL